MPAEAPTVEICWQKPCVWRHPCFSLHCPSLISYNSSLWLILRTQNLESEEAHEIQSMEVSCLSHRVGQKVAKMGLRERANGDLSQRQRESGHGILELEGSFHPLILWCFTCEETEPHGIGQQANIIHTIKGILGPKGSCLPFCFIMLGTKGWRTHIKWNWLPCHFSITVPIRHH